MQIRPSNQEDLEFLRTLHHRAYRDVVVRQFGDWDEKAQDGFFAETLKAARFGIIEHDGADIGAIAVREDPESVHIVELQLQPEWQNRGLGTMLVREQIEAAKLSGKSVRLRVLHQNRARELYARLDFSITEQTETHLLMEWTDDVAAKPPAPSGSRTR